MRLQIKHTTTFTYDEPISEAYTEMRLSPMETGGQRCLRFRLTTEPRGEVMAYGDRYGNLVHYFDTLQLHDRVVVTAISEVCQDFAHVCLAACRSIEIPARYVSGYLYNPSLLDERRETGMQVPANAASHAWVDVYLPEHGWLSLDPTHNCWQTASYVRVAVGRDYADVSPTKGIYKGTAAEKLGVSVTVKAA